MTPVTSSQVLTAHGDAWQVLGVAGTAELPGVRLSATALPHPQWNNGDVDDPTVVDVEAVRGWYAARGVPWGLRVPTGARWPYGRRLFTKRLMGLAAANFVASPPVDRLVLRAATPADLDVILPVDAAAFGEEPEVERPWLSLLLAHPAVTVAVAEIDGQVLGTGAVTLSHLRAGHAGYVSGVAVAPPSRRQGIGCAVSAWLVARALDDGAALVHLHPDTDAAARIYQRLGFVEVAGLDIYVGV